MKGKKHLIGLILMALTMVGCGETVIIPKIAEPFGPPEGNGSPSQHLGFGTLPKIDMPGGQLDGQVDIKTDLPTLQQTVSVLRLQSGNLNLTEFQNLTQAIGLPAGLIGEDTQNLGYTLTWTNKEGIIWQLFSSDRRIVFTNPTAKPKTGTNTQWLGKNKLIDQVDIFLKLHGINELKLRNIQIIPAWGTWMDQMDNLQGCVPPVVRNQIAVLSTSDKAFDQAPPALPETNAPDCVKAFPSAVPVSFERLLDGWNILDKYGQPELGGQMMVNSETGEIISGWMTLPTEPQRSDYPAINNEELLLLIQRGGLVGALSGYKETDSYSFAFTRLPKTQVYGHEYLTPALVAETKRSTEKGMVPYRIIVPLIKQ